MAAIVIPRDGGSLAGYAIEGSTVRIGLDEDFHGRARHWFYFQILDIESRGLLRFVIQNAASSLYPRGWTNYRPVYSADGSSWQHTDPCRVGRSGSVEFAIASPAPSFFVAWYQPYTVSRLAKWTTGLGDVRDLMISSPYENFPILTLGKPRAGSIVIIARQHPGETMASFFVEGLVAGLLARPAGMRGLLEDYRIVIFPLMNPEGAAMGRHRYSEAGVDFNRCWGNEAGPKEVLRVKETLAGLKDVRLFFDIHGDEVTRGAPNFVDPQPVHRLPRQARHTRARILSALCRNTKDLEVLTSLSSVALWMRKLLFPSQYPVGKLATGISATEYVQSTYGAPAFTYEIKAHGTDSTICAELGGSMSAALAHFASTHLI